jgi:hypothetical protein
LGAAPIPGDGFVGVVSPSTGSNSGYNAANIYFAYVDAETAGNITYGHVKAAMSAFGETLVVCLYETDGTLLTYAVLTVSSTALSFKTNETNNSVLIEKKEYILAVMGNRSAGWNLGGEDVSGKTIYSKTLDFTTTPPSTFDFSSPTTKNANRLPAIQFSNSESVVI